MKIFGVFIFALLISCSKDHIGINFNNDQDYLIFGVFYGECILPCGSSYKIQDSTLNMNTNTKQFITHSENAIWAPLSKEKYFISKKVLDSIPFRLLKEPQGYIGSTLRADGPDYFLTYNTGGIVKTWSFGSYDDGLELTQLPSEYKKFSILLGKVIKTLR